MRNKQEKNPKVHNKILEKVKKQSTKVKVLTSVVVAIAMLIILTLLFTNLSSIKEPLSQEIRRSMTYDQVQKGDENIDDTDYVKFDAFFLRDLDGDGYAESIRGSSRKIGEQDTLYMNLKVTGNGHLEDGVITINEENMYFQTALVKDEEIKNSYINTNTTRIELNTIRTGTQKLITGSVRSGDYSVKVKKAVALGNNSDNYSKINSVTLTGTHIAEDGTKTKIQKTVPFRVDWHGTAKSAISLKYNDKDNINQKKEITEMVDQENNQVKLVFSVKSSEINNELNLKRVNFKATVPNLNGYAATSAQITGGGNLTSNYDTKTKILTANKEAITNESGKIISTAYDETLKEERINNWNIEITYPIQAYNSLGANTIAYKLPIEIYYEGYNNQNTEFTNPYKSNTSNATIVVNYSKPEGDVAIFKVEVGIKEDEEYFVSKEKPLKMYNGASTLERQDQYLVKWIGASGRRGNGNMIIKETANGASQVSDRFIRSNGTEINIENLVSNVGIYFANAYGMLGQNGYIKVYNDQTNELLETFTSENWDRYDLENPYYYKKPVKHIRIETSNVNTINELYIYHIKEIDDNRLVSQYTKAEFNNLSYIQSTVTGYMANALINTDTHRAIYENPVSKVELNLGSDAISTQKTEENTISIDVEVSKNNNYASWKNGSFLVKLPKEVVDMKIKSIESSNEKIIIANYEQYEENGNIYLKIITTGETGESFSIAMDVQMAGDSRKIAENTKVELYAHNENCNEYVNMAADTYDVNGNTNTTEKVAKEETTLSLMSPSSLLTGQYASNFDEKGTTIVAPQIAIINKSERNAKISLFITNNYASTISEIKILGKIPTKGNKYTLEGEDLGSTFSSTLTGPITLPSNISSIAKVYYSTEANPNQDLSSSQNNWVEQSKVSNWSQVKSYLINLQNYVMPVKQNLEFNYQIKIPAGLDYNNAAYSHHAVYFSLDTTEGKYRTSTEPSKLGFTVAKQYNLAITKYQKGKEKLVPGATYLAIAKGEEEGITAMTDKTGKAVLKGLYAQKEYAITEIISPKNYELSTETIKINTTVNNSGELSVQKLQGTTKGALQVQTVNGTHQVLMSVEDEVKASLQITKVEKGTTTILPDILFRVKGTGIVAEGQEVITDKEGKINLSGLSLNQEYTLEEKSAEGYYLTTTKFKITKTNGTYQVVITSGSAKETNVVVENELPSASITLENEKIPTYTLALKKVKANDDSNKVLSGARYSITSEDTGETNYYTTDINGTITIGNLYSYVSGKYITGNYTLKELRAPEGYSLSGEEVKFKVVKNGGSLSLSITKEKDLSSIKEHSISGNTVNLVLQDNPIFSIKKVDKVTKKALPSAKFIIQKVDLNHNVIGYAKDADGNYVGEKNSSNQYIITTDENGEITTPLQGGFYKITEVEAPAGYVLPTQEDEKVQYFTIEGYEDLKINYIEDLLEFAKQVDNRNQYSGKVVTLARNLDFNEVSSYKNPNDTSYGDYNGDGTTQGIKDELTNTNGYGFKGIGIGNSVTFSGTFLGNDFEIRNVYMCVPEGSSYKGMFYANSGKIENLGITGTIKIVNNSNNCSAATGTIACLNMQDGRIINCYSKVDVISDASNRQIMLGGIAQFNEGIIENCYNAGNIKGTAQGAEAAGIARENLGIIRGCYNTGNMEITTMEYFLNMAGIVVTSAENSSIESCYNTGNLLGNSNEETNIGGIAGIGPMSILKNCYNAGEITIKCMPTSATKTVFGGGIIASTQQLTIENCSNRGNITVMGNSTVDSIIGGIVGASYEATTKNCYNTKKVSATGVRRSFVGGVAGQLLMASSIINCYNTGEIMSSNRETDSNMIDSYSGGIVGYSENSMVINTYNTGTIKSVATNQSGASAGGIIGYLTDGGKIYNSYNIGAISGSSSTSAEVGTGGIAGYSRGIISNTYNTGTVTNSTSGYVQRGGIIGYAFSTSSTQNCYFMSGTASTGVGTNSQNQGGTTVRTSSDMQSTDFVNLLNSGRSSISTNPSPLTWKSGSPYPTMNIQINIDTNVPSTEETNITTATNLEISNTAKTYQITTEIGVNSNGTRTGGTITGTTISGTDKKQVETITHEKDAQTNIQITPNTGYVIKEITLDGTPIEYTIDATGKVTLPKLEKVTQNHHYLVTFDNTIGQILVHHYLEGTTIKVAEDENISGKIGEQYTTSPKVDLEEYELKKEENGEYKIPSNAVGTYQRNVQEITYYYQVKKVTVAVRHYIQNTEDPVPLANGELSKETTSEGNQGDSYTTKSLTPEELNPKYELVAIPENSAGILEDGMVIVTYYYKVKQLEVTTRVEPHKEIDSQGNEIEVAGGSISGQKDKPYETVEYGENSAKKIVATPKEGYQVSKITVNGENIAFTANDDGTVEVKGFVGMTENKEVVVAFARIPVTVIVHHYIKELDGTETTIKVPARQGTGKIEGEGETAREVVADEVRNGSIGANYATKPAENVTPNYKVVSSTNNTSGTMTKEPIEVIYYYQIKQADIITNTVNKTGTDKVTRADEKISYIITYNGEIAEYIGNAKVTITDKLPYEIDKEKSNLMGGVYNAEQKTITWEETIENIDTYENGNKQIEITKQIEVMYKNMDFRKEGFGNRVKGKITFDTVNIEAETEEVEKETKFEKLETELTTAIQKTGDTEVIHLDTPVYYEVNYTATINNFIGKAVVRFVDKLPYAIDEEKSDLSSLGTKTTLEELGPEKYVYNAEDKTITWEEEVTDIDTYNALEAKVLNKTKTVSLKYIYGEEEYLETLSGNLVNTVTVTTNLVESKEPTPENPSTEKMVKTEEKQDDHEVAVKIPTKVMVHHYIYDSKKEEYTSIKVPSITTGEVVQDEEIAGTVGESYTTKVADNVAKNYEAAFVTKNASGTMTKTPIEVIYYYRLIDETVTSEITKTAKADKTIEREVPNQEVTNRNGEIVGSDSETTTTKEQVEVLTTDGGAIRYSISYKVKVENYIGKAKVTIVDTLPNKIKLENVDLKGGNYNRLNNTITWEEEITGIDTFAEGKAFETTITKEIELVYEGQNKVEPIMNKITGTVKTYYPDNYPIEPSDPENPEIINREKTVNEKEDTEIVEQEYKVSKTVEKVWEDNNNAKSKRPAGVRVQLTANEQTTWEGQALESIVLSEENNWTHIFEDLPKYDREGNQISYSVQESEVNEKDLEYYDEAQITLVEEQNKMIVTNSYKLINTELESKIEKTGTEKVTSTKQEVNYHISYRATIKDYIGEAIVTITDTLPYHIDTTTSDLAGGTYNETTKTITWTQNLGHINTTEANEASGTHQVSIEKDITLYYTDIVTTEEKMTNNIKGKIEFIENETKNEVTDEHETLIDIKGRVITKYVEKATGEEIAERKDEEGKVGLEYSAYPKTIYGYTYIEDSGNTVGKVIEGTIEIIFYYEKTDAANVTVKYVDEEGNEIVPQETVEGKIGDSYTTEQKEFEDYEFEEITGDNPEGTLDENPKEVIYHYKKLPTKIIIRYLEKETEKELALEETKEGKIGDTYETTRKIIEGYQKTDPEPENASGTMTKETIIITYYYEKIPSGKITVKYVDVDTKQEITYIDEEGTIKDYIYEIKGYVGDKYETSEKEIPYYEYLSNLVPSNKAGIYTQDDDSVVYYYRKLPFNISVEKTIKQVIKNGKEYDISRNNKITKVEVKSSEAKTSEVQIKYNITVSNTGEIEGTAKVIDKVPSGLKMASTNSGYWKEEEDGYISTTVELKAKETKKLEVALVWRRKENDFGGITNKIELTDVQNPANYLETSTEDNTSEAIVVISVQTGERQKILVTALGTIATSGLLVLLYQYQKYHRERNKAIRHVVLEGKNVVVRKQKQK